LRDQQQSRDGEDEMAHGGSSGKVNAGG